MYKEQRNKVNIMVSRKKRRSWDIFEEQMESNSKGNEIHFYKVIKDLRKRKTAEVIQVKDAKVGIVKEEQVVMKAWRKYLQEFLTIPSENGEEEKLEDVDMGKQDGETENVKLHLLSWDIT